MNVPVCPSHRMAMEKVPAEPVSRCLKCGGTSLDPLWDQCPQCGQRVPTDQSALQWRCPICSYLVETPKAPSFAEERNG
jgi:rubrerythrin